MYSIGRKVAACIIAVAMLVAVAGCSGEPLSTREKGTGIGALVGAGTGAIIGAAVGAPGAGAAIGGVAQPAEELVNIVFRVALTTRVVGAVDPGFAVKGLDF